MKKILSIDDSKAVHSFIDVIFKQLNCELWHAYDGKEGVTLLESGTINPDIILLDWEMPVMTGIETLKAIRQKDSTTPICMLTSKNSEEDISLALQLGASDYIMKPFTKDIIVERIETILDCQFK